MLNREQTEQRIRERMEKLDFSETCALFLLSADRRDLPEGEQEGREDFEQSLESLLSRFFRISEDIVGEISKGRFAAFLNGRLTERVVWDKARTLSEALWFSADASERDGCTQGCVGVYLFHAGESTVYHRRSGRQSMRWKWPFRAQISISICIRRLK